MDSGSMGKGQSLFAMMNLLGSSLRLVFQLLGPFKIENLKGGFNGDLWVFILGCDGVDA